MNFLIRFNALLNERELTAYKVSKETGMGERLVNAWKTGERRPSMDNLVKLADYFDVSIDYLVGRTDNPKVSK